MYKALIKFKYKDLKMNIGDTIQEKELKDKAMLKALLELKCIEKLPQEREVVKDESESNHK